MAAYLISHVGEIANPARYDAYVIAANALVSKFSGRLLVRGDGAEVLEGTFDVHHTVVFEFPTMADIRALWNSAEYRAAKQLREGIAPTNAIALPGV
jgi:uncharacterized protein (DUF1330 family)